MAARILYIFIIGIFLFSSAAAENVRPFKDDADAKFWLENMLGYHYFTIDEVHDATGLSNKEISATIERLQMNTIRTSFAKDRLTIQPYPGGRHPRIGFLDGAVDPQRETKISIFLSWDHSSYVVADVPEAIWSNLGLTYLAHTHVPTIWTKQNTNLPPLEWKRVDGGALTMARTLPNGIQFGTEVRVVGDGVRMREWLRNSTDKKLSDLRVQNCVMLKGEDFIDQTNDNKIFESPYAAARSKDGRHWIITAWAPIHRAWGKSAGALHSRRSKISRLQSRSNSRSPRLDFLLRRRRRARRISPTRCFRLARGYERAVMDCICRPTLIKI
jgi:hypothetical protein